MGVQLGSWLLIPACGTSSAKVVYWPPRLTCVAQACIRVTAVPWQVRRRDAAAAVPAEPVLPSGSQSAVSAGQLAWIARLPGTGSVLVCELLVRLPAVC
jgi:hypothetical protein